MKLSVIYYTYRPGGIDLLAHSLEQQTHRDYELIVVDDYKDRDCTKYLQEHDVPVRYYGPSKPKYYADTPYGGCNAINTGLLKASKDSEAAIIVEDYAWLLPTGLELWSNEMSRSDECVLMTGVGVKWEYKPPQHMGDITIWDHEFTEDDLRQCTFKGLWVPGLYRDTGHWGTLWDWHYCAAPMAVWETLNGLDERFDYYRLYPSMYFPKQVLLHPYSFFTDVDNTIFMIDHRNWTYGDERYWSVGKTADNVPYKRLEYIFDVSPNNFNLKER